MTKSADDFDAARQIIAVLEPFENLDRERILRWSREKLGMGVSTATDTLARQLLSAPGQIANSAPMDIRSFIAAKNPRTDVHLAAVVAYFNRFVAPESERNETISQADLLDACRKSERQRPSRPAQTLVNAFAAGLFDKAGRGQYKLNSVGENLVAVVLPGDSDQPPPPSRRTNKRAAKTSPRKKRGGSKK